VLILSISFGQISKADSLYQSGNQAMIEDQYLTAISSYEEILIMDKTHADVYYNLGNAYYRQGLMGNAVWAYKMGLKLAPRDKDLNYNLSISETYIRDRVELPETFFLLTYYRKIKDFFTTKELLLLGSILLIAAVTFSTINKFLYRRRSFLSRIAAVIIIGSFLAHGMALEKLWQQVDTVSGIIIASEINVYSSPFSRNEAIIFKLHEGLEVEINQNQTDWVEITLLDGNKGWIKSSNIRIL
jgi:tetratricopeptide (TPR) repeat protein